MSAVPVLAKIAIPLGIGTLLFLTTRKGKASEREKGDKAIQLTSAAVGAMQRANGNDLELAINGFNTEADSTTAGALGFQHSRMTSRGTRGFTSHPTYDKDSVLKVDNREFATRLIQLEGRAKALDAWAEAYQRVGAKNLARDLRDKAKALRAASKPPKADKDDAKPSASSRELEAVIKRVTEALASLDPAEMRRVAAQLRKEGFKAQAESLEKAANEIEAGRKGDASASIPTSQPTVQPTVPAATPVVIPATPTSPPIVLPPSVLSPKRTVTVLKGDSESRIAKRLIGDTGSRWNELVTVNVPRDAEGRKREKITRANLGKDNANRLGALRPGLQPGQKLFIPDNWKLLGATPPALPPAAKPPVTSITPVIETQTEGQKLTSDLITHVVGKTQGKEDAFLVRKWQSFHARPADGKYGPGDAVFLADTYARVPPTPLYWPKKDTAKALTKWKQEMARLALQFPVNAAGFQFASDAGKQPGFNAPSSSKVVSRMLGDGLGAT